MLDKLAVMAGEVVLEDQQNLAGIRDEPGQRRIGRIPIASTEEGEVLAPVEGHVVVGEPDVLGAQMASDVLFAHRLEFEDQRVSDRFLCHAVTVTRVHRFCEITLAGVAGSPVDQCPVLEALVERELPGQPRHPLPQP